jgi:hypothetical protein
MMDCWGLFWGVLRRLVGVNRVWGLGREDLRRGFFLSWGVTRPRWVEILRFEGVWMWMWMWTRVRKGWFVGNEERGMGNGLREMGGWRWGRRDGMVSEE